MKNKEFENFGEYFYWCYANLQMLFFSIREKKYQKYDRMCYILRQKAFNAYKDGTWKIHDLYSNNTNKLKANNFCWYCGKELPPKLLTADHVFAKSKGGLNTIDNIIMVCKNCNSSKSNIDLFKWYAEVRKEWPPTFIIIHYLKNIYLFSIEHELMNKHSYELDNIDLPFDWHYIPFKYPTAYDMYIEPIEFVKNFSYNKF